jgi:catecholate siderophore receptor
MAQSAEGPPAEGTKIFKGVTVTGTAIAEEPGREQASPKAVRPLLDTPQTVTVLGKEVLQQQNLLSLKDALSTVPGISFGAGEGGSGYGDNITLRGFSANNDITVDGVRDSAQYSRSDVFNVEQIEVSNGASSVTTGAGAVGGNINLVSKRPVERDQAIVQGGIGTKDYYRGTVDINEHLTDDIAFRLNAMAHRNDVPGRKYEFAKRWGVAPAVTFGMTGKTQVTLQYYHQQDHNLPQFGVPYFATPAYTGPLPGVDRSDYYGYRNIDTQRINIDQGSLVVDHEFTDKISIRNLSRYQDVHQFILVDGPEGVFCLAGTNRTPAGAACTTGTAPNVITVPAGFFFPTGGSRGNTRDTHNTLAYNQTDLKAAVNTGGIEHTIDFGFSISHEKYDARTGNSIRGPQGQLPTLPLYPNLNPDAANIYTGPLNFLPASLPRSTVNNQAIYLFDALKLSPKFEINAGLRWENNKAKSQTNTIINTAGATFGQVTVGPDLTNQDHLFSYRAGLVYKPVENASIYIAYGNSKTPSQSTVNAGCTFTPTTATPVANCSVRPEKATNYEIGGKIELFNSGLLLTAALFRNDRNSYKVASGDPTLPDQQTDGKSRVDGLILGASGHATKELLITANYAHLKSKLIQSVSNKCLAAPGSGNCTNTVAAPNPGAGMPLTNTPKDSGSVYVAYYFPFGLTLGYGATYQGRTPATTPTAAIPGQYYTRSFLVHNATITYDVTKRFQAQLNVKNIGDELYFTRVRGNNGWATPGDARSAVLTITYKM